MSTIASILTIWHDWRLVSDALAMRYNSKGYVSKYNETMRFVWYIIRPSKIALDRQFTETIKKWCHEDVIQIPLSKCYILLYLWQISVAHPPNVKNDC